MNESKIAVRYAKALFMSSEEKKLIQEVRKDMKYILELSALADFRDVIDSPVIENSMKRNVMAALLKDNVNELSFGMLMLTVENNREAYLPGIARCYIDMADKAAGITKVNLTTADGVSKGNRDKIKNLLEEDLKTKVDLEELVDHDIEGGFVLKVEDMYVDASVRSSLRKIKKELLKTM